MNSPIDNEQLVQKPSAGTRLASEEMTIFNAQISYNEKISHFNFTDDGNSRLFAECDDTRKTVETRSHQPDRIIERREKHRLQSFDAICRRKQIQFEILHHSCRWGNSKGNRRSQRTRSRSENFA